MGLALTAVAGGVFFALPRWVASRPAAPTPAPAPTPTPAPAGSATPNGMRAAPDPGADPRERAEAALARLEPLRAQLAERAVERWAAVELAAAERRIAAGEERFAVLDHAAAAAAWEDAAAALEAILAGAPGAIEAALAEGRAALERGDSAGAQAAYARALAIAPEDAAATAGARRAASLDRVLGHLAAAARYEASGEARAAASEYRAALTLDPDAVEAHRGLARLDSRASEAAFAAAMGEAFTALEAGDRASARRGFEQAAAIRPEAPQVREGLRQVEAAEQGVAIAGHRERGAALASDEAWREALDEYEKALARDPTLAFARVGRDEARERAELAEALASQIARPERLAADEVLREARALLLRAGEVARPGPRHEEQVAALERLLAAWSTPVPVRLESDGVTEVTVYRVGRLGRFSQHALELRPGRYTVVGSRRGYRDVRLALEVRPGESPAPLGVRCADPI
jgi:tetratricopeptide (TPR) repeat protein